MDTFFTSRLAYMYFYLIYLIQPQGNIKQSSWTHVTTYWNKKSRYEVSIISESLRPSKCHPTSRYVHTMFDLIEHDTCAKFFPPEDTLTNTGVAMYCVWKVCDSQSAFITVFTIKRHNGACAARARGVLMVKILNKYILSILVYNLYYKQTVQYFHTPQCSHTSVYWTIYLIGRKNR